MFSEIDTQTSWQTNFSVCPVISFVSKIGNEMMAKLADIASRFGVVSARSLFDPGAGPSVVASCASFLDALNGTVIPKRSSRAWKTHLF